MKWLNIKFKKLSSTGMRRGKLSKVSRYKCDEKHKKQKQKMSLIRRCRKKGIF